MAIDGTFIHFLAEELKGRLEGGRVSKVLQLNPLEFLFLVRSHGTNLQVLFSSSLNIPRVHLTNLKYIPLAEPLRLGMFFRKNLEGAIISKISQIGNDRALQFVFEATNEIGDHQTLFLFLEMMGRNSNLIVTREDLVIIDASRFLPPSDENYRIVIPKATYALPHQENTVNPFEITSAQISDNLSGCSKQLVDEFRFSGSIQDVIRQPLQPTLIDNGDKQYFHAFDLKHLEGKRTYFDTLSEMLDHVYGKVQKDNSAAVSNLKAIIKRELVRSENKLQNLNQDRSEAEHYLGYQRIGELLQANIYQIKKGDESVTVSDFYHDNEPVDIKLDPKLDPSGNLEHYFTKAKKAKKAVVEIARQLEATKDEISYLKTIDWQIDEASGTELAEIQEELVSEGYIRQSKGKKNRASKSKIETYQLDDALIYVGKNNFQNDFLTNHFANSKDFFFHVKDAPGAHTIVRCVRLDERIIRTAAMIAAKYSTLRLSESIPVDYTSIKDVKKIPGRKGSNVILKNQKTIYIDIDEAILKNLRKA